MQLLFLIFIFIISGCGSGRYVIKGTVVDSLYQKPVQMAIVQIGNGETKTSYTDNTGSFFFAEKKKGKYTISAYARGFKKVIKEIEIKNKEENIIIKLPREFSLLTGVVVDAETGEPLSAVLSFISMDEGVDPPANIFTDPVTGLYRVEILPGHYRVKAQSYGYKSREKSVIIK